MEDKIEYLITFEGQGFSANDFYTQRHHMVRSNIKNKYGNLFRSLIEEAGVTYMLQYRIDMEYNSRHDPSNVSGMLKVFEDSLAGMKKSKTKTSMFDPLIPDDSKQYCKGVSITPDLNLKLNTFKFKITKLK